MTRVHSEEAFSSVELLVTMFVASAFIATGFQLYSTIIRDGLDTRQRIEASNIAYAAIRLYAPQVSKPCAPASGASLTPIPAIPTGTKLAQASISVDITCPYSSGTNNTSKVSVEVRYDNPVKKVMHTIYVYE